ncbi:hypothetical protein OWP16_04560 [Bacillus paranthracis]|uniref:hypothetical protein n=1 Tax=Bacillus paranthracis TaxID=2026186 RepID=UPI002550C50B|nr:hypothetical protein [Bacillus paranthracis]MDK7419258.1 hypothetical protein [Bacillus paranthracis]MDK7430877.1 hypothetical protein [Bacillus paranthracis]MDK7516558.1 hypothetical protein [Bacillus paranthracis]MDK7572392.1 hypothetical protein [Bacillus paranthracis]
MQDKLIQILSKIAENPNPDKMVLVKKAIVEFCQREGFGQSETLTILNQILVMMDNQKPVTLGCVKYHWLNDNVE